MNKDKEESAIFTKRNEERQFAYHILKIDGVPF